MIHESWYWKRELVYLASEFETWGKRFIAHTSDEALWEESGFRVERSLFYSALTIRRLIDSNKVTDKMKGTSLHLQSVDVNDEFRENKNQTIWSATPHWDIEKLFNLEVMTPIHMSPYDLASEILHSFALVCVSDENDTDIDAFIVASDRSKFVRAVRVPRQEWTGFLYNLINDSVNKVSVIAVSPEKKPRVTLE